MYVVFAAGGRGDNELTLCSVWGKCCSGRTRPHRRTHPRWRSKRSLAQSARGGGCEWGMQCHCSGPTDHSLRERERKKEINQTLSSSTLFCSISRFTDQMVSLTECRSWSNQHYAVNQSILFRLQLAPSSTNTKQSLTR